MPIFEYRCPKCGHAFEKIALSSQQEKAECPQCGSKRAEKQFSAFSTGAGAAKSSRPYCPPSGSG